VAPGPDEVEAWCREVRPPYFVKPFYGSMPGCAMKRKNQIFLSGAELARYARSQGLRNTIVQRRIESGDGRVYDAYGLCDRRGEVVVLASHRRIRQFPPDTGATSFGEIPVIDDPELEGRIFRDTRRLLSGLRYHGIFGIEWLHERGTGEIYLADFNARPFSSIGHLADCGLNLPLLAYRELVGEEGLPVDVVPALLHRYWMDFNWDVRGFRSARWTRGQGWADFVADVLRCTSFAYFDVRDPGPWVQRGMDLCRILVEHLRRR
jgi:predicted ATP-grasp superfamily ATP-dependent carboligase